MHSSSNAFFYQRTNCVFIISSLRNGLYCISPTKKDVKKSERRFGYLIYYQIFTVNEPIHVYENQAPLAKISLSMETAYLS